MSVFMGDSPQYPTTSPLDYIRRNTNVRMQAENVLRSLQPFIMALDSEIGRELLADLMDMHSKSLAKIASLDATEEDKMRYAVLTELIKRWAYRIEEYEKKLREVGK